MILEQTVSRKCGEMRAPTTPNDPSLDLDEDVKSLRGVECDDFIGVYSSMFSEK